jgi:hypothetical protein
MFDSHLSGDHVGSQAQGHVSTALPGMSGMGDDAASVPAVSAPIQPISPLALNLALLTGAALIAFLFFRAMSRSKKT